MDFDDTTDCPRCGKRGVRVLGMDAHQRSAVCRAKQAIEGYLQRGEAPMPEAADPPGWMLDVLRDVGIEPDLDVVAASGKKWWERYTLGFIVPEWAALVLHIYRDRAHLARGEEGTARHIRDRKLVRAALALLRDDEELRAELVVLARLGGLSAARARLSELVDDAARRKA